MEKYELTENTFKTTFSKNPLYRIRALKDFVLSDGTKISKGDLGGYVSSLRNLSQDGNCWIMPTAAATDYSCVLQSALLKDDAFIKDNAVISGSAIIKGYATIENSASVTYYASVGDSAVVSDNAVINGFAVVKDRARVSNNASVLEHSVVQDNARIIQNAIIKGFAVIKDDAVVSANVSDLAICSGNVVISANKAVISGETIITGNVLLTKNAFIKTSNTIGTNIFNDEKYSFNLSSDMYTEITDKNFKEYALVPVSGRCCMLFRPSGFISLYLPNLSERYTWVPYSNLSKSKKELWEGLMEKIVSKALGTPKGLSSEELLFYEFFLNTDYIDIEEMITEASDIFFKYLLTNSSPLAINKIRENLMYLLEMYQRYLFAYFIGFLLRLFEKIYDLDEYVYSNNPIKELLDCCCVDLVNKTISSLGENLFYNNEIIRMIKNVCGFSEEWETKMISLFSGSFRNAVLLKGLIL